MAQPIDLTGTPIRVTSTSFAAGTAIQPLTQVVDVSAYDQVDLVFLSVGVEGAPTDFKVALLTGMSDQTEDGWVEIAASDSIHVLLTASKENGSGLLRFLRWKVKSMAVPVSGSVTFTIAGMLRNN